MPAHGTVHGTVRAHTFALTIMIAAFMQGYDSGVAGGVLTFAPFTRDFNYTASQKTGVNSLTVGLQQLGAFVSCFFIFWLADAIGRKRAIIFSTVVFMVGAVVQTVDTGSLGGWYAARFIAGVGQGGVSVVVPVYSAEMSPPAIRGRLGSLFQWMYTLGIFTSYWVDYGVKRGVGNGESRQWQVPVGLQLVWGGCLLGGMMVLRESVRWLVKRGRLEEAWESLVWIRCDWGEGVVREFEEIKRGIEDEYAAREGLTLKELMRPVNRNRFGLGAVVFLFQQATGATALAYFGPQFFQLLVGKGDKDILLTALFGAVKLFATTTFILFIVERFARRKLLMGGAGMMAACMLSTALVYKFSPTPTGDGGLTSRQSATVALIFINIAFYNWSWGPLPWAYVPEIFPTRTRALGMAVAMSSHWLFSFTFSISTPYMLRDMGWGLFLFYACLDVAMAVFCWFFIKETKDKTLERVREEMEGVRGDIDDPVAK